MELNSAGNFVWAKAMGGPSNDVGWSIATDASGNVYTTGCFNGTVDFDPGVGTFTLTSAGSSDIFISKMDVFGNFLWAIAMGGTTGDQGKSIALDTSGNIYTAGSFNGTIDFDPGSGVFNLSSAATANVFISKLDASGNFVWAKAMGGTSLSYGNSIILDPSGNIYTTGYFSSTGDFDPSVGTFNLTSTGSNDVFISKLDSVGNFIWAKAMGGGSTDQGHSIAIDTSSSSVYATGTFGGSADFDPNAGTFNLTSAGSYDIYIAKYNDGCSSLPVPVCLVTVDSASLNNIIVWDKITTARIDSFIICHEYTSNNYLPIGAVSYDSISMFIDTVRTKYFPITGDPNMAPYRYKLQVRDTCGNYSPLSLYHNTVHMVNNSGNFSWNFYEVESTPNPVTFYVLKRDNFNNGNWITVGGVSGTQNSITDPQYSTWAGTANWRIETQWNIECTPTIAKLPDPLGNIKTTKSNTFKLVNPTGVNESSFANAVVVSPNPSSGLFTIQSSSKISEIEIMNVLGEKVFAPALKGAGSISLQSEGLTIDLRDQPKGVYFYKVQGENGTGTGKIIIE